MGELFLIHSSLRILFPFSSTRKFGIKLCLFEATTFLAADLNAKARSETDDSLIPQYLSTSFDKDDLLLG